MQDVPVQTDQEALVALNARFAEAEWSRDAGFFGDVLADDLVFRRANGTRVGKAEYLAGLVDPGNTYSSLEAGQIEVIMCGDDIALVSLHVRAAGERSGTHFEGDYRNTRMFVKRDGDWRCAVWFNSTEPPAAN